MGKTCVFQIYLTFRTKSLCIPNISYFASKNDYFYPNICIFENFVVPLREKTVIINGKLRDHIR